MYIRRSGGGWGGDEGGKKLCGPDGGWVKEVKGVFDGESG